MKQKWIAGATKNAHGQFAKKAHDRGMSTRALAAKVSKNPDAYSPKMRKQAALARTLMKMGGRK